jgi:hypothetical protein
VEWLLEIITVHVHVWHPVCNSIGLGLLWGQAPPRIMVIWIRSNVFIRNL